MTINVQFFASLRELTGKQQVSLPCDSSMDLRAVWLQASGGLDMPANTLCAINLEYVKPDAIAQDGDEVAYFPPVTGG